jgi:hypothetical protein
VTEEVSTPPDTRDYSCQDCDAFWVDGKLEVEGKRPCLHENIQRMSECCGNPVDEDLGFCSCGSRV